MQNDIADKWKFKYYFNLTGNWVSIGFSNVVQLALNVSWQLADVFVFKSYMQGSGFAKLFIHSRLMRCLQW